MRTPPTSDAFGAPAQDSGPTEGDPCDLGGDVDQPNARDEARRWLSTTSGSTAQLLGRVPALRAARDGLVQRREGLLWLRYPDWFEAADWPAAEAALVLSDDGLLEPDPRTPMRRVRDHAGQRWLALNAEVSSHLGVLLDCADSMPAESAPASGLQRSAAEFLTDAAAHTDRENGGEAATSLIETILQDLATQSGRGDGARQILDQATLKTLAKQHRLGVYSLRERLLTDPRVTEDAQKRLVVTL